MEEGFDLDNILDSMNLTGQWQPSSMPSVEDPSLDLQILGDVNFSADDTSPSLPILNNNDDISNALMDPLETDDITKLISTSFGDLARQSTIEETMENMTLSHSQTDMVSSSICVQMGSSPVEHKEIENSCLVNQIVRDQRRMMKAVSKPKRKGSQQSSSNVGPVDFLTSYGACQPCTTVQMQSEPPYSQPLLQFDSMESKKIQIISHPRPSFRPRTQNESKNASHYIRCEVTSQFEYPTIYLYAEWARQSIKNIIEVTLVATDKSTHEYKLDHKMCKPTFEDDASIFRQNEPHTLYFCLTPEDFTNGFKSFMFEYIKSKQEGNITKDLIKNRQLDQSMLRFTRIYQADKNTFLRDENSVEYSCIMTEAYGDIAVEHMGPRYGPISGNENVYSILKGRIAKEDLAVIVSEETTGWRQPISITKNGNLIYFPMPAFPYSEYTEAVANITMYYKGDELHQSVYLYKGSLDQELAALNLSDSNQGSSTGNTFNAFDFFSATGVCPVTSSSKKSSTTKRTKRLNNPK